MAITVQDLIKRNIDNQKQLVVSDGEVIFYYNGNAVIPHYFNKNLHNSTNLSATGYVPGVIISELKELDSLLAQLKTSGIRGELPTTSSVLWSIRGLLQSQLCCTPSIDKQTVGQFDELKRLLTLLESKHQDDWKKLWYNFDIHYDMVKDESLKMDEEKDLITLHTIRDYAEKLLKDLCV